MVITHVGTGGKHRRKPVADFIGDFFSHQIIGRIDRQFQKLKGGSIALYFRNLYKAHRLARGGKKSEHISSFDTSQIAHVDVVATVFFSGCIPQGYDLSPNKGSVVIEIFKIVFELHRIRQIGSRGWADAVSPIRRGTKYKR
jgi:hypothetical protein